MSKEIEQRVVEMRFDNKQFESATAQTMSTLDKLKQKLNFKGASKGLENVGQAAKKVDMSGLSAAVDTVRTRFSALEVMGVTALANITNSAVNAGKRMVSALTMDPILTGFQEYETQMGAIQTILANTQSKGSTLDDVNSALSELNKYADQTIYNFTEMTKNIGTFTAAGVGLDASVNAIKGIANLAAVSGSTSQQASTAMYQLSQALAAGRVSLMDWNSVVNAGMGGEVFQTALIRTARQMGTGVDEAIKKYGTFRESLTQGQWLTAEVLTETLAQISGAYTEADLIAQGYSKDSAKAIVELAETAVSAATDVKTFTQLWDTMKESAQSGWAQTWQLIVGDFEESKALFSEFGDLFGGIIQRASDARNSLLESALSSNWDKLTKQIEEAGVTTEAFNSELEKTIKAQGLDLDTIIKSYGSLENAFRKGALESNLITKTLRNMAGATTDASGATVDLTDKLTYFQTVVNKVWKGDYANGEERIKALTEAGYDYATVQDLVNKTVDGHRLTLEDLTDVQLEAVGYTSEEITKLRELADQAEKTGTPLNELIANIAKPSGRELIWDSVFNILNSIISISGAVKKAWENAFPPMTSSALYKIIEGVNSLTEALVPSTETLEKLTRTFAGLFAVLDIITTITGGALKTAFKVFTSVLGMADIDILGFTAHIGDLVVGFRDWLLENNRVVKGFDGFIEGCRSVVEIVRDWINAFLELPYIQSSIADFTSFTGSAFNSISGYFSGGLEALSKFINRVKTLYAVNPIENLDLIFRDFSTNVIGYFTNVDDLFDSIVTVFSNFRTAIETNFAAAGEKVRDLATTLLNFASMVRSKFSEHIGLGEILAVGIGAAIIFFATRVGRLLDTITSPLLNFSEILDSLSNALNAYTTKIKSEALKNIAISIGIMAASLFVLAQLDWQKLLVATGAIVVLTGALVGMTALMGNLNKFGSTIKSGGSFAAIGAAILILVVALKQLEGLNSSTLLQNMLALTGLGTALVLFVGILSRISPNMSTGALTLTSFAVSIKILVGALDDLNNVNTDGLGEKIIALSVIILALSRLMKSLSVTKVKGVGRAGASALSMIGAVIALKLLIGTLEDIADIDSNKIIGNLDKFVVIFGMFSAVMIASHFAGVNAAKAGVAILAMSVAMNLIVPAIKGISKIAPVELDRASEVVSKLLLVFGAVTAMSALSGKNAIRAGTMALAMSGAIVILSGAIAILSHIDPAGLDRAVEAIIKLELIFGVLIAVTKLADKVEAPIVKLSVVVGLLSVAIGALAMIDQENLNGATNALSQIMLVFSVMVASTKLATKATSSILLMTGVVAALAGILLMLSGMNPESAIANAAALSTLMITLSASFAIVNVAGPAAKGATKSLLAMTGVMTLLGALLFAIQALDIEASIETVGSIAILMAALSAAVVAVGMAGTAGVAGGAAAGAGLGAGLLTLLGVIGIVAAVVAAAAAINSQEGFRELMNGGLDLLADFGYGLGKAIGSIVGGLGEGITSGLPGIGENLSGFMESIQGFISGASNIDASAMDGVKSLASALLVLTGADLLSNITSFMGGGESTTLSAFGAQLLPFGQTLVAFSAIISDKIDEPAVTAAANAGLMLAELNSNLPRTGGKLQEWIGEKDLAGFSENIQAFGGAIVAFSNVVTDKIDEDSVNAAANAGMALANLNNNLPSTGGKLQEWLGTKDLSAFGSQLWSFGIALVNFSKTVAGNVQEDAVISAANAGMALAELNNNIPSAGGTLQSWLGEKDLSAWGARLWSFGTALRNFSSVITRDGGIDYTAVESATNAAKALAALNQDIPTTGGIIGAMFGEKDMSTFGAQLQSFGQSFMWYSTYMRLVNPDILATTTSAADSLVQLAEKLPDNKLFTNETTLDEFGSQLKEFGWYFSQYYSSVSTIDTGVLSSVISQMWSLYYLGNTLSGFDTKAISNFGSALTDLGKAGVDGLIEAFDGSYDRVRICIDGFIGEFITAANNKSGDLDLTFSTIMDGVITSIQVKQMLFNTAGAGVVASFVGGVMINTYRVTSAFGTIITSSLGVLNSEYESFKEAGKNVVEGFAEGIRNNVSIANAAARYLANQTEKTAKNELDIHSPSGVFENIGNFVTQGLNKGINDGIPSLIDSASNMGQSLIFGIQTIFGGDQASEMGREIVSDISEGITEDMSAEEAAEQKAQNIVNAFKEKLDDFDLDLNTADLEYQLWEGMYGTTASESEKTAAQLENLNKKIQLQTEKVKLAQAEYNVTMAEFGASATQTQEAYNKLLQEQIDLTDIASQITSIQDTMVQSNNEAYQRYLEYLNDSQEELLALGFTMEQLEANARNKSGYNPDLMANTMSGSVQQAVDTAMANVTTAYQQSAQGTFNQLITDSTQVGTSIATGLGTGIQNGAPTAAQNTANVSSQCVNAIHSKRSEFVEAGGYLVEGFAEGIDVYTFEAEAKAAAMANAAYTAAMAALNAHSPSRKFMKVGGYVVAGFAQGIENNLRDSNKASEHMAQSAIKTTSDTISRLVDSINSNIDTQPTIRPVLDLSDLETGTRRIGAIFSRNQALRISSSMQQTAVDTKKPETSTTGTGMVNQFIQNNYSPKALSRVEIYRQTKNQFSAFERTVKV